MAADPCCDDIIGGEIYITARFASGGFIRYEGIGEVRIQPSRVERTAGATTAGMLWVTEAARPVRAIMSFANRCSFDPMLMWNERCKVDVTVVEKSRGFWHTLSRAAIVGNPEKNLSSGEISGIELVSDDYISTEAQ